MKKEHRTIFLNKDELPHRGKFIQWGMIEPGFIIKIAHDIYGENDLEYIRYEKGKQRLHVKHNGVEKEILTCCLLDGEIGRLVDCKFEFKQRDNFKILNIDEVPMTCSGIDWKNIPCGFVFNTHHEIYGNRKFELIKYENYMLYFKCDGVPIEEIHISVFLEGKIGAKIGEIQKDYKYHIGQEVNGLIITEHTRTECNHNRAYRFKCLNCGFDCGENYKGGVKCDNHCISEYSLIKKHGCACCSPYPNLTSTYINSIYAKARWMIDLGVSLEDAKIYTPCSNLYVWVVCPDCGETKRIKINDINKNKSISCNCGGCRSYPEKFIMCLLDQLGVKYEKEYKINDRYYDFYLPEYNIIIEAHGEQHYIPRGFMKSLEEQQRNDEYKRQMAKLENMEAYIEIDCRKSELEFIKNNTLKELGGIFNLENIDWIKCEEFALKNRIKEICDYWCIKEEHETTADLAKKYNCCRTTIGTYLTKGTKLGWCNYDPKEESEKSRHKTGKTGDPIAIYSLKGEELKRYPSRAELLRRSEEDFNETFTIHSITNALKSGKPYKNYIFKLIK